MITIIIGLEWLWNTSKYSITFYIPEGTLILIQNNKVMITAIVRENYIRLVGLQATHRASIVGGVHPLIPTDA